MGMFGCIDIDIYIERELSGRRRNDVLVIMQLKTSYPSSIQGATAGISGKAKMKPIVTVWKGIGGIIIVCSASFGRALSVVSTRQLGQHLI
jgi:hypothetical protein